ncbi:MAG: YqiJ family protein [Acidimicrobiia bacterium]|nr:YqiJ family protein [Acidimicrobiia bacterium]
MEWIYLASAIFGGSFLIPMVLGGLASDVDVDFDTDVDVDMDVDLELDGDLADAASGEAVEALDGAQLDEPGSGTTSTIGAGVDATQAIFSSILSFRSLVFFAAFFGVAGLVFGFLGYSTVVTAVTALALGLIAALANSTLWGLMKSSELSSLVRERSFEGRPAVVTVPIELGRRGRIRIEMAGQPHYLVAEAIDGEEALAAGRSVLVVEIERGVAKVAALPELE